MSPLARLSAAPWLIREDDFRALCRAAASAVPLAGLVPARRADDGDGDAPARGPRQPRGYSVASGVAVVPVYGPIYRHSTPLDDLIATICGGVSVDCLADAIRAAAGDPGVRAILLAIDSPGGQAAGIGELAGMVRAASAAKPVAAYVEAKCCSAAYWIAAAAGEITAAPSSFSGSIGAVCVLVDDSGFQEKVGIREIPIVSTQSPLKCPDPATDAGRAAYQKAIDDLAAVFIADVARYRATTAEAVASGYGRGASLIASEALKAGMIDKVGSLDDAIRKLSGPNRARLAVSRPAADSTRGTAATAAPPRLRLRPR